MTDSAKVTKAMALVADAVVMWMTTVRPDGQPQSSPVWFVVDDGEFLIYSMPSQRIENIAANRQVALNLDSNEGSDVVSIEGTARVVDGPANLDQPDYQKKYGAMIEQMGTTREEFSTAYSIPIRVTPTRWRVY
ncbi:MAG TPA: pyridoxamine 5'-phosphate oxidase family protein [Acidimicrobiia bacterium]